MPKFNVEHDWIFEAQTGSVISAIKAAQAACPEKMDQLLSYVFTHLGLTMQQQGVISLMLDERISADEIIAIVQARESQNPLPKKEKMKISKERLKSIFRILIKENLIKAANTWQFITYWLEKNCEGWTGEKGTQSKHLQDVLGEDIILPTRAFKTHDPSNLRKVMENPNGKLGRFHSAALMRLKQLCEEVRTA